MFQVHKAETSVRNVKPPNIMLSRQAAEDMFIITDEVSEEVGGVGTVRYLGLETHTFLIEEIFLPRQEVHSTTTELDPEGMAELMEEILRTRKDGMEVVNSIRFWFHSHVNMGLSPSGQDSDELHKLCEDAGDYFIAARTNKQGRIRFDMETSQGFLYHDLPWDYEPSESGRRAVIQAQIKERVKQKGQITYIKSWPKQGAAQPSMGKSINHTQGWSEGLWGEDDWPGVGSLETGEQLVRGSDMYIEKDSDGVITKAWIDIIFKGMTRTAIIDTPMFIDAEFDPEILNWAPASIDLDHMVCVYPDASGMDVEVDFQQLDELEIEAVRAIFRTAAVRVMSVNFKFAEKPKKKGGKT